MVMSLSSATPRPANGHIVIYYVLALTISQAGWIPYAAQQAGMVRWHIPDAVPLLAQYSPLFAAVILTTFEQGWRGPTRLLGRMLRFRFGLQWYAVALLTAPAVGGVLVGLHALNGTPIPRLPSAHNWPSYLAAYLTAAGHSASGLTGWLAQRVSSGPWQAALVFAGITIANGGLSEEPGWRGYALTTMLKRRERAIVAALWIGVLWGLWHMGPDFWIGIFKLNWSALLTPVTYPLITIPLSVLFTWVFINANGSLVPTILFHASYNATFSFLTALWTPGKPVVAPPEWALAFILVALVTIVFARKTLFARKLGE